MELFNDLSEHIRSAVSSLNLLKYTFKERFYLICFVYCFLCFYFCFLFFIILLSLLISNYSEYDEVVDK